jgi:uncharacterized protein YndB with AHSA1/START domain
MTTQRIEAKATHRFDASPERVFDAWLDPRKVRVWMAAALKNAGLSGKIGQIQIEPRIGGSFLFSDFRDGVEARHWGTYLELDRPHRLAFTWIVDESEEAAHSKVTLTIEPDGEGCIATIVHELDAGWAAYLSQTEQGWARMLKATAATLRP